MATDTFECDLLDLPPNCQFWYDSAQRWMDADLPFMQQVLRSMKSGTKVKARFKDSATDEGKQ